MRMILKYGFFVSLIFGSMVLVGNCMTIGPTGQGSPLDTDQDLQRIMANSGVKTEDLNTLVGYG